MAVDLPPYASKNCAVREFTADGISVGRCWHYVGDDEVCPRHGDVTLAMKRYRETGKLMDEDRLKYERSEAEGTE